MTTPKFLRTLFLNELGLLPTQNIRSIMKVLMIDTKEECYEIMKIIYEETQKPNRSVGETPNKSGGFALPLKPVNRFDNLPLDLKRLIKSYLPPNKLHQEIHSKFECVIDKLFRRNSIYQRRRDNRYKQYIDKYKNIPFECYVTNLVKSKREDRIKYKEALAQQDAKDNAIRKKYADEYQERINLQIRQERYLEERDMAIL